MVDVAFPPLISDQVRLLILGSMPSQTSLKKNQYYAHPRNAFWWIMSQLFGFDPDLPYRQRCEHLLQNKVGIWDVLHACERPGSLDANIVRGSEQINDFDTLLNACPQLNLFVFNGRTAETLFEKHCKHLVDNERLRFSCMPSTSPAHASISRDDKLVQWRGAMQP